jgi:SAM-dependent methyltransferase
MPAWAAAKVCSILHRVRRSLWPRTLLLAPVPERDVVSVDPAAGTWVSLGDDPSFTLIPEASGLAASWVALDFEVDLPTDSRPSACLYLDRGSGYSQTDCVELPPPCDGRIQAMLLLPEQLRAIRFDPLDRPGAFRLGRLSVRRVGPLGRTLDRARPILRALARGTPHALTTSPPPSPLDPVSYCRGKGIEIGAHNLPIAALAPIYVDRCREYAHAPTLADLVADAASLPFGDATLDYVAASHVIEHMPRTLAALREWHRVIKDGGYLYLVVPDRRKTFDRDRVPTSVEHVLADDRSWSPLLDVAHAVEMSFAVPIEVFEGRTVPAAHEAEARERYCRGLIEQCLRGETIGIHYHTWSLDEFLPLIAHLGWELTAVAEDYPPGRGDGFCVLIRVRR